MSIESGSAFSFPPFGRNTFDLPANALMMTRKNVLVIDDVSVIRSFVKAALRSLPIDFREASDGTKGLEMHNGSRADLIICDMNMP
ncbi:MAG: response regulator, partial [Rhodocyclaceae bacterium]|nr:response regulator [Rhodocyclaceae bacterium]